MDSVSTPSHGVKEEVLVYLLDERKAGYYRIAEGSKLLGLMAYGHSKCFEERKARRGQFHYTEGVASFVSRCQRRRKEEVSGLTEVWIIGAEEREVRRYLTAPLLSSRLRTGPPPLMR